MACPDCGSWSVRADRSLSGRLVCGRCGRPLGIGTPPRRGLRFLPRRPSQRRGRPAIGPTLLALLLASALITALVERPTGLRLWPSPDRRDPDGGESGIMIRNIPR